MLTHKKVQVLYMANGEQIKALLNAYYYNDDSRLKTVVLNILAISQANKNRIKGERLKVEECSDGKVLLIAEHER